LKNTGLDKHDGCKGRALKMVERQNPRVKLHARPEVACSLSPNYGMICVIPRPDT
jgi:hypothetical protein